MMHLSAWLRSALLVAVAAGLTAGSLLIDTGPYTSRHDGGPVDGGVPPNAPTTPVVRVTPETPRTSDALVAEIVTESTDPLAAGPVQYEYAWDVGGTDAAISDPSVPAERTTKGEVWTVHVTPVSADGARRGAAATASVTIANSPPQIAFAGLSTYRPIAGEVLRAFAGPTSDPDGDGVTVRYAWTRNGQPIDGQVSNQLDTARITVAPGDRITVQASARDTEDGNTVTGGPALLLSDTTRWRQLLPHRAVSFRGFAAFDSHNRRLIFGYPENDDGTGVRVWEYGVDDAVGGRFVQLFPTGAEPPVSFASVAYDARNRRVLLIGARRDIDSGPAASEVIALDVAQRGSESWSQLAVAGTAPEPRFLAASAYDEERGQVLLYGGLELGTGTTFNDLWALDVTAGSESWAQLTGPVPPATLLGPALVVDPERDRALLIAGGEADSLGGDPVLSLAIFTLDLTNPSGGFVQAPTTVPRGTILPTSGLDATGDRALVAFGIQPDGSLVPDALAIDLATLTASVVMPGGTPPDRGGRGLLVPDRYGDGLFLFPGATNLDNDAGVDLYRWGAGDVLTPIHRTGVDLPIGLVGALLSDDLTLYGGTDDRGDVQERAWRPGGTSQWQSVELLPDAVSNRSPGPRAELSLQSSSAFGSDIQFFGGRTNGGFGDGQMWVLRDNRWIEQTLAAGQSAPSARTGVAFFVPACGGWRSGYFGGQLAGGGLANDTGFFQCSSGKRECDWTDPVETLARPPARAFATVVRFNDESEALLFGGEAATTFNDVWSLYTCGGGPQPWRAITPAGTPPSPRSRHTMTLVEDPTPGALESVLVFGGASAPGGSTPLADVRRLVRLSSTAYRWEDVVVASGPDDDQVSARFGHVAAWDERQSRLLVYGGERRGDTLGDFWELRIRP